MTTENASLPDPDPDALERSRRVSDLIRSEIASAGGHIPFDRYMQLALYAEDVGYYTSGAPIFGPRGDFVTAPESGTLFARCLASQCAQVLGRTGGVILEYGAGSGALAQALLETLSREGVIPERYLIVEPSAALAARQREFLGRSLPRNGPPIEWYPQHPDFPVTGVVIANEVLDAMPVKRFVVQDGIGHELNVIAAGDRFDWQPGPPLAFDDAALAHALRSAGDGYVSEYNPALGAWLARLRGVLREGIGLLFDYGYPRHEYLHPSRRRGTLKCHYRHLVHDDPFRYPGLQDITAAVDFTAVAESATNAGFDVAGFASQARFLLASGLEACLAGESDAHRRFDLAQEAKRLLLPSEMGQTCRALALAAGRPGPLCGFRDDERHRLAGFVSA